MQTNAVTKFGTYQANTRLEDTRQYISQHYTKNGNTVLGIGFYNQGDRELAEYFELKYCFTRGDLDDAFWFTEVGFRLFPVVFCFEVLEHLHNPLLFLVSLKDYINENTRIFLSTPLRPCWLHTHKHHWHELDRKRIQHLFDIAGYEVIHWTKFKFRRPWWRYFIGIRTPLRFFFDYCQIYTLRLK